jgi:hypothetical protein
VARVFISFAPSDLSLAVALADALQRYDVSVHWADQLQPSQASDEPSDALAEARGAHLVVALFSKASANSERVLAVAREALDLGTLLAVLIGEVCPTLPRARPFHCALWDGSTADFGFSQLVYEISLLLRTNLTAPTIARRGPGSSGSANP